MIGIAFQVLGSVLILLAFILAQMGRVTTTSLSYLLFNAVGAIILGINAFIGSQWGFVLLEGVWSVVALQGLWKYYSKK